MARRAKAAEVVLDEEGRELNPSFDPSTEGKGKRGKKAVHRHRRHRKTVSLPKTGIKSHVELDGEPTGEFYCNVLHSYRTEATCALGLCDEKGCPFYKDEEAQEMFLEHHHRLMDEGRTPTGFNLIYHINKQGKVVSGPPRSESEPKLMSFPDPSEPEEEEEQEEPKPKRGKKAAAPPPPPPPPKPEPKAKAVKKPEPKPKKAKAAPKQKAVKKALARPVKAKPVKKAAKKNAKVSKGASKRTKKAAPKAKAPARKKAPPKKGAAKKVVRRKR